jgi:hypothetical protein
LAVGGRRGDLELNSPGHSGDLRQLHCFLPKTPVFLSVVAEIANNPFPYLRLLLNS